MKIFSQLHYWLQARLQVSAAQAPKAAAAPASIATPTASAGPTVVPWWSCPAPLWSSGRSWSFPAAAARSDLSGATAAAVRSDRIANSTIRKPRLFRRGFLLGFRKANNAQNKRGRNFLPIVFQLTSCGSNGGRTVRNASRAGSCTSDDIRHKARDASPVHSRQPREWSRPRSLPPGRAEPPAWPERPTSTQGRGRSRTRTRQQFSWAFLSVWYAMKMTSFKYALNHLTNGGDASDGGGANDDASDGASGHDDASVPASGLMRLTSSCDTTAG